MTIESIGTWAGEVYKALETNPTDGLGMKSLKKATKLNRGELMAGLGLLGIQRNLSIWENDEEIVVTPV